jgi:hypothetical protein
MNQSSNLLGSPNEDSAISGLIFDAKADFSWLVHFSAACKAVPFPRTGVN